MKITPKQYAESLYHVIQDKKDGEVMAVIENFIKILQSNNNINKLDQITEQFCTIWNKEEGIVEAEIVSAKNLDNEIVKTLNGYIAKLSGAKKVLVKQQVDKNILGGVIIRYEDKILDGSIKNSLSELRNEMVR